VSITTDPKFFSNPELQWLQWMLNQLSQNQDTGTTPNEHALLKSTLKKVRAVITHDSPSVSLTEPESLYFLTLIEMWKEGAGNYQFKGPYGTSAKEGLQFPDACGIDTVYGPGLAGSFDKPGDWQDGANIIDDIIHKLRGTTAPEDIPHV
jgi:hypothetical protein